MNKPSSGPRLADHVADLLRDRVAAAGAALSPATREVARFIAENPAQAVTFSAADLGARLDLSDVTVIRAARALGFAGMAELRRAVAAALQGASPAERMRRTLHDAGAEQRAVDLAFTAHDEALAALRAPEPRRLLLAAVARLAEARRIVVFGIGPTAHLARYTAMLLARAGRAALVLDATGSALADQLLGLAAEDAVLLLAYGAPYREATTTQAEARRRGLPVVLLTDTAESELARRADVVLPVPRGRAGEVALHGATLVALEALMLGIAARDPPRAVATLERLAALRARVAGGAAMPPADPAAPAPPDRSRTSRADPPDPPAEL